MHNSMLRSVLESKIRFFDLNPIGRIMNRFSKDVGNIDDVLPMALFDCIQVRSGRINSKLPNTNFLRFQYGMKVLGAIVLAVTVNYVTLIPLVPVVALLVYIRFYYMKSSRETLRIEAICNSI